MGTDDTAARVTPLYNPRKSVAKARSLVSPVDDCTRVYIGREGIREKRRNKEKYIYRERERERERERGREGENEHRCVRRCERKGAGVMKWGSNNGVIATQCDDGVR